VKGSRRLGGVTSEKDFNIRGGETIILGEKKKKIRIDGEDANIPGGGENE